MKDSVLRGRSRSTILRSRTLLIIVTSKVEEKSLKR